MKDTQEKRDAISALAEKLYEEDGSKWGGMNQTSESIARNYPDGDNALIVRKLMSNIKAFKGINKRHKGLSPRFEKVYSKYKDLSSQQLKKIIEDM